MEKPSVGDRELQGTTGTLIDFNNIEMQKDTEEILEGETFFAANEDNKLIECFLNLPPLEEMINPITIINIINHQSRDLRLQRTVREDGRYSHQEMERYEVICYTSLETRQWKIVIPETLLPNVLRWYHLVLGHCGTQRLYDTVSLRFHGTQLSKRCKEFLCIDNCNQYKNTGRGYGHMPPRNARLMPWDEIAVDLIGPWKVNIGGTELLFKALTCIDPVTNLVEIIRINNKSSRHVAEQFANCWLSRYPRAN